MEFTAMSTITSISIACSHKNLIQRYKRATRSVLKAYFLKNVIKEEDVAYFRNYALAMINDINAVLENAKGLSEANKKYFQENITLLTTFMESLVITDKEHYSDVLADCSHTIITYAIAG
jgi:hypothetical protein